MVALGLPLFSTATALAEPGTPVQRRACTPDVYRLCAITAFLRRQKEHLSGASKAFLVTALAAVTIVRAGDTGGHADAP
jgi:hypothetical protein